MDRRSFIGLCSAILMTGFLCPVFAAGIEGEYAADHSAVSNFISVYDNPDLRNSFLSFLKNVYSIYSPDKFHALISDITAETHLFQ